VHDSGKREQFKGGTVRDTAEGKPRPDLASPFAEKRIGEWFRLGAEKYAARNWETGMPISRVWASLRRHVLDWQSGDRSEDHLAAIAWNAEAIMHYEEMIVRGRLPEELADMPDYKVAEKFQCFKFRAPAVESEESINEKMREASDCLTCMYDGECDGNVCQCPPEGAQQRGYDPIDITEPNSGE